MYTKLKSCWICGNKDLVIIYARKYCSIQCENCPKVVSGETENEVIDEWNSYNRPAPEPYTIYKLRLMKNTPIYVVSGEYKHWCVWSEGVAKIPGCCSKWYELRDYGKSWVAYDSPLEEEDSCIR